MKSLTDALHARTVAGDAAPLALKVTLRSDETLQALVNVPSNVSVEIDGMGRTITLLDSGFQVDDGRLCLHDVELTGGRNVPALIVLGQAAEVNTSHVRISDCSTRLNLEEVAGNIVGAFKLCKPFGNFSQNPLAKTVCSLLPRIVQQCCDEAKASRSKMADVRLVGSSGAGTCACGRTHP
jgi:hypothetical protein